MWICDFWSSGIDFRLPGNGGPDCLSHSSLLFRTLETLFTLFLFYLTISLGWKCHSAPQVAGVWPSTFNKTRRALFVGLLVTYLAEIFYKAVTFQFIFVVNPCHLLCLIHLYLLSNIHANSTVKNYVFRIHLFYLHGPVMACIFPVTNTLFMPGEVLTYWLEHAFLLITPVYLLCHYTVPSKTAKEFCSWQLLSYGLWGIYHYVFLQPLALMTLGNLNSILCPAITDPFRGPYYRLHALWHQFLVGMVSGLAWWFFSKSEDKSKCM